MLDVSFTELLIIGIVALVVLGPERLPKVARTVGHLLGRAQRYVNDVKREINQEISSAESLGGIKKEMEDAAKSLKDSVTQTADSLRSPLEEAQAAIRKAESSLRDDLSGADTTASPDLATDALAQPDTGNPGGQDPGSPSQAVSTADTGSPATAADPATPADTPLPEAPSETKP